MKKRPSNATPAASASCGVIIVVVVWSIGEYERAWCQERKKKKNKKESDTQSKPKTTKTRLEQAEGALPVLALEAEPRLQRQDPPVGPVCVGWVGVARRQYP